MESLPPELTFALEDGVGILTLNRPDKRNALTTEMYASLRDVLQVVNQDDEVKVLVVTGTGTSFCAGSDIETRLLSRISNGQYVPLEKNRAELLEPVMLYLAPALYNLNKPSIAAINGTAAGAGLSIALLCDFRIASEKAKFVASWLNVGLTPDVGATFSLPRIIGVDKALKLFLTGEAIDAREAERINLVTEVVPHDSLMKETMELATKIAAGPSLAIELAKRAVYKGITSGLISQLHFETYAQNICFMSGDFREGVRAFLEKRPPRFEGR